MVHLLQPSNALSEVETVLLFIPFLFCFLCNLLRTFSRCVCVPVAGGGGACRADPANTTEHGCVARACLAQKPQPALVRKLENAKKQLTGLYTKMAYRQVDPTIVGYIHQLAWSLQNKDYKTATTWHQYLITQNLPSDVSGALLGMKALIHVAQTLAL
jgi:hypothetical protein